MTDLALVTAEVRAGRITRRAGEAVYTRELGAAVI